MTRQRKTPKERAEEALAVSRRKIERLERENTKHNKALQAKQAELEAETVRCTYLAANPDLKPTARPARTTEEN